MLRNDPAMVIKHIRQVKVVHHLPGRLRIHVPLLERLSSEWRRYQGDLIEMIGLKEGLLDVEMSIITGRILIHYDPGRTNQGQILRWFRDLALSLYEEYMNAPFHSRENIRPFLKKMRARSQRLIRDGRPVREIA